MPSTSAVMRSSEGLFLIVRAAVVSSAAALKGNYDGW